MPASRLPDVIFNVSLTPSYIADYFVKERGYKLLELPFPSSLALRQGWVANAEILAFTYNVDPPIPAKDIQTIGTNLQVVANSNVDPEAISKMLEVLYSPSMIGKTRQDLKEEDILTASNYPISAGTEAFMSRKDPIFSQEDFEKLQGIAGIGVTVLSTLMFVFRRMKGKNNGKEQEKNDQEDWLAMYQKLARMEGEFDEMRAQGHFTKEKLEGMIIELNGYRQQVLGSYASSQEKNSDTLNRLLQAIQDTRSYVLHQLDKTAV
jgi:hypothetical protein